MKRCAIAFTMLLAGCGGSGGGAPVTPAVTPSAGPTATASPTSAPTSAAAPVASPASISFVSGTAQNVKVVESGYTGAFSESDTCDPYSGEIASVAAVSSPPGSATYSVTPIGAGTCTITATDSHGHGTAITVTVSTAAITVQ